MPGWLSPAPGGARSSAGGRGMDAILINSGWEVPEPTSCPGPIYLVIGAEIKGSDVLLVLLGRE